MKRKTARSVLCIILVLILVLSLVSVLAPMRVGAVSQSEIDALEAKRDQLQAQQKTQQQSVKNLQSKQASIVEQKEALDQENELARQEIAVVEEQIVAYDGLIDDKTAELDTAKAEEEEQAVLFRSRVRELEENGKISYIAILLESKSLSDLLSRIDMIGEIIAYDKKVEDELIAAREKVEEAKQELEDARSEQEDKKAELETQKAELEQKIASASALIADLQSDIDAAKKAADEFEAAERSVQAQIDQQVAALRQQEEQQQQKDPSYDPGAANGATGSMMWPCPSTHYVTSKFGWRYHPIFHENRYHSGVDIGAGYGATIVAADGGTVITAGSVSGYGNCVVINHGNGLTTLYGHMSSIAVSVGQRVSKGQTIGYVGSTGNSTGPHLHWEVSVNGQRVNPLNYAT
ncbi:MAG: peptidoglycan DD-metalloendopeptidase family protein [Oscillospiraceae bacterium]|nr:peptidoglycan DD-metalloendopeptidase family protein [Oscillospiraceae bacterium]